jgi:hypothetical protein
VHEPERLLIAGRLDGLGPRDTEDIAGSIRDLGRDTAIVATGRDSAALAMACGEVLTLADGIIVRNLAGSRLRAGSRHRVVVATGRSWTRGCGNGVVEACLGRGFGARGGGGTGLGWSR